MCCPTMVVVHLLPEPRCSFCRVNTLVYCLERRRTADMFPRQHTMQVVPAGDDTTRIVRWCVRAAAGSRELLLQVSDAQHGY